MAQEEKKDKHLFLFLWEINLKDILLDVRLRDIIKHELLTGSFLGIMYIFLQFYKYLTSHSNEKFTLHGQTVQCDL